MNSSQAASLHRTLSREKFEQLCHLWQQMAELAKPEVILLGEGTKNAQPYDCFRLLVSPDFSALLLGKPTQADLLSYQVNLTFDDQAIADFLAQLSELWQNQPNLSNQSNKIQRAIHLHNSRTNQSNLADLQNQFILKLLEILSFEVGVTYPRFYHSKPTEEALHKQLEQERILNQMTLQISQNLDWLLIVKMTIEQVLRFLQLDRLVVYQLNINAQFKQEVELQKYVDVVTYEALATEEIPSILHFQDETCFADIPDCRDKYRQGFCLAIDDINTAKLSSCLRLLMKRLKIRAKLVAPIIVQERLWGFLIAHQCFTPRQWKQSEIQFLLQIAEYLAIAVYQAQSYQQLQEQKNVLEAQVNQRAQELQDALLAAQAAHLLKSEFLGNMSHELRTPLTCVIGLSGTLLRWSGENKSLSLEKQQQYLQTIHDNGKKLLELVNNILEFSQIEAGKSLLNLSEFSLYYLSQAIVQSLQAEANRQGIKLELEFRVNPESDRFYADQERVQQILFHLLDNAIKFTIEKGTVILRVWQENKEAVFQVEDTGIGISEHHLPLVFEKFQQLEKSRQRTYGGAGLGLALTKQLVEMHQGTIEVESLVGQGSLFTVRLPNQSHPASQLTPNLTAVNQSPFTGIRLILIEKDEELATLICELLTAAGYQIVWLIDTAIAISQIELLQPTAVIIDYQLPDVYEISKTLKKLPVTSSIKVLILIDQVILDDWQDLSDKGVDDYLVKPVKPTLLLQKVNALLTIKQKTK